MRTKGLLLLIALLALSVVPSLAAAQESLIDTVCLITDVGRINDGTFNQFAYEGMDRAAKDFGLESTYQESRSADDYRPNMDNCIRDGYDAIITVGFLMTDFTREVAAENPDRYFIGVDQFVGPDANGNPAPANWVGLQFREDQAGFLAGALGALMSETGVLGGVYGMEIPPVVKFRNGYEQGAKYINPDVTTLGSYIPDFNAPAQGVSLANQFLGENADVIFGAGGKTGSGGIVEAAKNGAFVIGVDQDEYLSTFGGGESPGAENLISSAMKRVDNAVYAAVEALINGGEGFNGGTIKIMSAENDGVGLAPAHDSTWKDGVEDQIAEIQQGLKDGTIVTGVDPVSGALLAPLPEVVTAATTAETPEFTTLLSALETAGMAEKLAGAGPFTVFAPTDAAFAAATVDMSDAEAVLNKHIVEGKALTENMLQAGPVTTLGGDVTVTAKEDGLYVNDSAKIVQSIPAGNGVIYVIDGVLLPE